MPSLSSFSSSPLSPSSTSTIITNAFLHKRSMLQSYSTPHKPPPSLALRLSHPLWLGATITFFVGVGFGTLLFLLWRCFLSRCTKEDEELVDSTNPTVFSPTLCRPENLHFIKKLQYNDGLPTPNEFIGRGGCGEVYRAEMVVDDRVIPVAIKRIKQQLVDAGNLCVESNKVFRFRLQQVRSEIMTVGRMRHVNLVRLLAHVPNPGCHYLVYEFMPNGSLHDVLEKGFLNWPTRYQIALGIAAGLEYLHMVHKPPVIHRDLKPANILLDHDFNARITDFGLAKVVQAEMISTAAPATASRNVVGTIGYIAPEYYQTLSCTEKCDVYSFGVILAVLVTGKFPSDEFFQSMDGLICIVGWLRKVIQSKQPEAAIDRRLVGSGFEEQMMLVLKVACFCTYDDPDARANSREARCMLSQIKH